MLCDHSLSFFYSFCHSVNRITDERGNGRRPILQVLYQCSIENGISDICCFRGVILSPYNCRKFLTLIQFIIMLMKKVKEQSIENCLTAIS